MYCTYRDICTPYCYGVYTYQLTDYRCSVCGTSCTVYRLQLSCIQYSVGREFTEIAVRVWRDKHVAGLTRSL